jgi:hypothetical protein
MSANRVVTEQTERFFRASDTGDAQVVAELLHDPLVDLNWHCVESVRRPAEALDAVDMTVALTIPCTMPSSTARRP